MIRHRFASEAANTSDGEAIQPQRDWNDTHILPALAADPGSTADGDLWLLDGYGELPTDNRYDTLAHWRLHNGVWTDASGNAKTLTAQNGASLVAGGAQFVKASSQYASAAVNLYLKTAVTVEFWMAPASLPANGDFWGLFGQEYNLASWLNNNAGTYRIGLGGGDYGGTAIFSFGSAPTIGQAYWVQCVFAVGTGLMKVYVDGVLGATVANGTSALGRNSADWTLGRYWSGVYFDGLIDEVRVSSFTRSPLVVPARRALWLKSRQGGVIYRGQLVA